MCINNKIIFKYWILLIFSDDGSTIHHWLGINQLVAATGDKGKAKVEKM